MNSFKFALGLKIKMVPSGERGEIMGRAEYVERTEPMYFLRYVAGDGRLTEDWWSESALEEA
jgi:hypothetical protein